MQMTSPTTMYCCPLCHQVMGADTDSGEEFSCAACTVMVDVLDDDLTMVSVAPHTDMFFLATSELRITPRLAARH